MSPRLARFVEYLLFMPLVFLAFYLWHANVLALLAGGIGLLVVAVLVLILYRNLLLRSQVYDFGLARQAFGDDGTILRLDNMTVWFEGRQNPEELLVRARSEALQRLGSFLGDSVVLREPLRVLVFQRHAHFKKYFQSRLVSFGSLEALYEPGRTKRLTLFADTDGEHLLDMALRTRFVMLFHAMDQYKGFVPAQWLNSGLAGFLSLEDDAEARARCHRRLRAFLGKDRLFPPAEMFGMSLRRLMRLLRDEGRIDSFAMLDQLSLQQTLFVEYLCSDPARRSALADVVRTLAIKDNYDAVVQRHLGKCLAELHDDWKTWLPTVALPVAKPPPPDQRDALIDVLLPTLEDERAPKMDKLHAMRFMGRAGFTLGADKLIPFLGHSDVRLRDASAWALERISGEAHGTDAKAWTDWWNRQPNTVEPA